MKLGPFLVGIWFVLTGLIALIDLHFKYDNLVMACLALVAGVMTMIRL
jgi:hypothetical protein